MQAAHNPTDALASAPARPGSGRDRELPLTSPTLHRMPDVLYSTSPGSSHVDDALLLGAPSIGPPNDRRGDQRKGRSLAASHAQQPAYRSRLPRPPRAAPGRDALPRDRRSPGMANQQDRQRQPRRSARPNHDEVASLLAHGAEGKRGQHTDTGSSTR